MWVIAGVLLGLVVLTSLVGLHTGPHTNAVAGVLGVVVAVWLLVMAADGRSAPVLWVLVGVDLVVSGGLALLAWNGLGGQAVRRSRRSPQRGDLTYPEGAEGVAVGDLDPDGIVRVRGEQWSAVSVNGTVRAGARVQVLRAAGVRLDVWGEDPEESLPGATSRLDPGESKERNT